MVHVPGAYAFLFSLDSGDGGLQQAQAQFCGEYHLVHECACSLACLALGIFPEGFFWYFWPYTDRAACKTVVQ